MVSMRYHKVVADFEQLVKLLPPSAVASPLRSTVPLVDFWRTPESRLAQQSADIGASRGRQNVPNPAFPWRQGVSPGFVKRSGCSPIDEVVC
jgi:hypothetical protein